MTQGNAMKPEELRAARKTLGLSTTELAEALEMGGNGERLIRRWERGEVPVTGPAAKAIKLLLVVARCSLVRRCYEELSSPSSHFSCPSALD